MTESCKNCLPCIPFQDYPVCLSFFGTKGKQEITGYAGTSDLWHHTIVPHLPVQWKRGTLTHRSLPKKPPRLLANLPWMRLHSVTHSDKIQLRASVKVKLAGDTDAMSPPRSEWQSGRFIFEHTLRVTQTTWAPNRTAETFMTPVWPQECGVCGNIERLWIIPKTFPLVG